MPVITVINDNMNHYSSPRSYSVLPLFAFQTPIGSSVCGPLSHMLRVHCAHALCSSLSSPILPLHPSWRHSHSINIYPFPQPVSC